MFKKHHKLTGIILRRIAYRDADLILTILTKDQGKIDCLAKSARRYKSRFHGRLELLSQVQLEVFEGRSLDHLNEVAVLHSQHTLGEKLDHSSLAFFMAEITQKLIESHQQIAGVYPLLCETLALMSQSVPRPERLLYGYLVKLLTLIGFMPSWHLCSLCGNKLQLQEPIYLNSEGLAPHCKECNGSGARIPEKLIKIVYFIQQQNLVGACQINLNGEQEMLWQWLSQTLDQLLPRPVKSEPFLERILIRQTT